MSISELKNRSNREKQRPMKNKFQKLALALTFGLLIGISAVSFAQPSAPPPPSDHGGGNNASPGGPAPIGSGLVVLLSLGAAYGSKKVFDARKRLEE
jgi:hypothetical protein